MPLRLVQVSVPTNREKDVLEAIRAELVASSWSNALAGERALVNRLPWRRRSPASPSPSPKKSASRTGSAARETHPGPRFFITVRLSSVVVALIAVGLGGDGP